MGHIYKELGEIPVPDFGRPDGYRVYTWIDLGGGERKKIYIGEYARKDADPPTFYASDNLLLYFPLEWEKHYGSSLLPKYHMAIGNYALCLSVGHFAGLYPVLHRSFGPLYGNLLIDYAMYSIKERTNTAYLFKPAMASSFLFSWERRDDGWIADVFSKKITAEMIQQFKCEWIQQCRKLGISEVWLTVDGSNSNCESENSMLSQKGKAKSGKNVEIVSYIWAVSAVTGVPVTFAVNEGGCADCKAFDEIRVLLQAYGISVKGIILDRGFLTHDVLSNLTEAGYDYVVKLKEDTHAQTRMITDFGESIYWNMEYLSGEGGRFGTVSEDKRYIFQSHSDAAYIALYFDGTNGSERKTALCDKIFRELLSVEEQIRKGKKPSVSKSMQRYVSVVATSPKNKAASESHPSPDAKPDDEAVSDLNHAGTESAQACEPEAGREADTCTEEEAQSEFKWVINAERSKQDLWVKGFDSLASSVRMTVREMHEVYHSRDVSEKQFMISKSMLGNHVFRAHSDQGICTRAAAAFTAAIIRCFIMRSCQQESLKPARFIEEIDDKLFLIRASSGDYLMVNKLTERQLAVFRSFGIRSGDFETITGEINLRMRQKGKGVSQFHDTPEDIRARYKASAKKTATSKLEMSPKDVSEPAPENASVSAPAKKKAGRPPGRKNNKTLEREAAEKASGAETPQKRRPGRPPGSRNKKTIAREAASGLQKSEPRGKGRPKGRKDSKPRKRRTKAELQSAAEK